MKTKSWPPSAVYVACALVVVLCCALAYMAVLIKSDARVERRSYSAGWQYVVQRQPATPSATPGQNWAEAKTDIGILSACEVYSDGFAQLDGVTDIGAFRNGCLDAAGMTGLETDK